MIFPARTIKSMRSWAYLLLNSLNESDSLLLHAHNSLGWIATVVVCCLGYVEACWYLAWKKDQSVCVGTFLSPYRTLYE